MKGLLSEERLSRVSECVINPVVHETVPHETVPPTVCESAWEWLMDGEVFPPLKVFFQRVQVRLEYLIQTRLESNQSTAAPRLVAAMRYGMLNGGKRLRPALVYATYLSFAHLGGDLQAAHDQRRRESQLIDDVALAVELLHGYSLVHDDLPAMDDDDLRRGKPTCHRAFDEATAILAGDALQSLAFEVLAGATITSEMETATRLQLIRILALASGTLGMAAGQALDLAATGQRVTVDAIQQIHALKTGCLLQASVEMAACAKQTVSRKDCAVLRAFADKIGLAFQVQDDILDEIGDADKLGKEVGMDQARDKATYPAIIGLSSAKVLVQQVLREALDVLAELSVPAHPLVEISEFIVSRDH